MESALVILVFLAFLPIAFFIKMKRLNRASTEIIERFREHGAVKEKRAKTLGDVGLRAKPRYPFLMRDPELDALSQLLQKGLIVKATEGQDPEQVRYYLNEQLIQQNIAR